MNVNALWIYYFNLQSSCLLHPIRVVFITLECNQFCFPNIVGVACHILTTSISNKDWEYQTNEMLSHTLQAELGIDVNLRREDSNIGMRMIPADDIYLKSSLFWKFFSFKHCFGERLRIYLNSVFFFRLSLIGNTGKAVNDNFSIFNLFISK